MIHETGPQISCPARATLRLRIAALIPCLLMATWLAPLSGITDVRAETPPARLSGTVIGEPSQSLAIVELGPSKSRSYRVGDTIQGWGRVSTIKEGEVRLETPNGEHVLILSGDGPRSLHSPGQPDSFLEAVTLPATPDIVSAIDKLADDPDSVGSDLNGILLPLIDIPLTEKIEAVDGQPLTEDPGTARMIRDQLRHGNVVTFHVSDGENNRSIYIGHQFDGPTLHD